ncbi:AAA family ATPase [Parasediminibacterium sp. JCM 36343]|uniref:AAA family ATPase n=1 Tax=Parasediminibacterium sp. JCM 36343 TaxID=3374279 RepID=UPI00397A7DD6
MFIGNQGRGKSIVAKLISTLCWIEKSMVKGILRQDELGTYNRFIKQLAYQRIGNYIKQNTEIEYIGKAFTLKFGEGSFSAVKTAENGYVLPKIMYVPSERNFLSVVDRPDKLKNLPLPLYTFNDEYDSAKIQYASGIELPINKTIFEYDKFNKLPHIIGENESFRLRLSEDSSGFQSTVPLFLVSKYLTDKLHTEDNESLKENSLEEQRKLEKEIKIILEDNSLSSEVRQASLRQLSSKRKPSCFINIVEEPEQNLFPSSQQNILNALLEYANDNGENKLIMTTHSPYLINYITLAVKAFNVCSHSANEDLKNKVSEIVPIKSILNPEGLNIYELNKKYGTIVKLANYKGLPSDENYLNDSLAETNHLFAKLQEIGKGWH